MKPYLLILRDHDERWQQFSPQEQQAVIERFNAWNQVLRAEERMVGAGKLTQERGLTVRQRGEQMVVDGPFSEAKEAIGGYYCIMAESVEDAAEKAKECPILTYGGSIEVREVAGLLDREYRPD